MFDPNKTYGAVVWDMSIAVTDFEADDYVRNEDDTVKLFNMPNYDYSYICDDLNVNTLVGHEREGSNVMVLHNAVFTVKDLRDRLNQVGLPFDEVYSGAEGIICLAFATDDEEYNDE